MWPLYASIDRVFVNFFYYRVYHLFDVCEWNMHSTRVISLFIDTVYRLALLLKTFLKVKWEFINETKSISSSWYLSTTPISFLIFFVWNAKKEKNWCFKIWGRDSPFGQRYLGPRGETTSLHAIQLSRRGQNTCIGAYTLLGIWYKSVLRPFNGIGWRFELEGFPKA